MERVNRIDRAFADLAARGGKGLLPYLTAGYPDLATTAELLCRLDGLGVTAAEVGFAYSDSIADGPTIQTSFTRVLSRGLRVGQIFEMVAAARDRIDLPLLAMVSFSIVHRLGVESFLGRARQVGFDGLIIPDLSLEEAPQLAEQSEAAGLRLAMLVAPTSPPQRREQIARLSRGFIYYISVTGITGERDRLPAELASSVAALRAEAGKPVCVGFGISRPEQVRAVCQVADGAIVGSAIVRRIGQAIEAGQSSQQIVKGICGFVEELVAAAGCRG